MFQVETISPKMLDYYVGRGDAMIIDLRNREEYQVSHVKGAVNIPYGELERDHGFPQGKLLVLYCDRGGASIKAAKYLARMGYGTRSVIGGFTAYRGRNLVISGQP
ncbi:MAG: rhodanese-like domain-containing protein [Eubacteriales bacterium]|nr:rhodanese-like domain-containing protein [Eubacteriales bacterium]